MIYFSYKNIAKIIIYLFLMTSCNSNTGNMQDKVVNDNFVKKYGKHIQDFKKQHNISENPKTQEFTKIQDIKIDVTNKIEFINNGIFEEPKSPNQQSNEQYYPFVESAGYKGYIDIDNNFLANNRHSTNPFLINYYNINYGPFVINKNPFDDIVINDIDKNKSKYYPILPFGSFRNNLFALKNEISPLNKSSSIEIIREKR
jgi:hypothetical protein